MNPGDLLALRGSLDQLWPVDEKLCFGSLLQAIDDAERQQREEREVPTRPAEPIVAIRAAE